MRRKEVHAGIWHASLRRQQSGKKWNSWAVIQTIAVPGTTGYVDVPSSSGSYQYYVTAYNAAGESAPSGTTSARVK